MLEAKKVDAVVFDAPILQYIALKEPDVVTVGGVFEPEDYGFLLKQGSDLREPITKAILKITQDGGKNELDSKWFGKDE